jgi:hypothetical protein
MLNDALNSVYVPLKDRGGGKGKVVVFVLLTMWMFCVLFQKMDYFDLC